MYLVMLYKVNIFAEREAIKMYSNVCEWHTLLKEEIWVLMCSEHLLKYLTY